MSVFDDFGLKSPYNSSKVILTFDRFGHLGSLKVRVAILSHHIIFPLLTGFLFDLPWGNQVLISLVLVGAVFIVGDFSEALLALWHALTISALGFISLNFVFRILFNNLLLVLCVLILWFFLLLTKTKSQSVSRFDLNLSSKLDNFLILGFIFYQSPRGRVENLGFIYHADNQKSIGVIAHGLRSGASDLSLLAPGDTLGMPPFVKFFTNFVTQIGLFSRDATPLHAINSLSNSWIFLLLSYFVLGSSLIRWCFRRLNLGANLISKICGFLSLVWGFQVSHSAGYFPLFLLNTVVISFICTYRNTSDVRLRNKILVAVSGASLSFAMFGSWQPWLPVTGGALLFVIYKFVGRKFLNRIILRTKIKYFVAIISIYGFIKFMGILAKADLESPGRDHFPTEIILVFSGLFVIAFKSLLSRNLQFKENMFSNSGKSILGSAYVVVLAVSVTVFGFMLQLSSNQQKSVFLILFIGLVFNRESVSRIQNSCRILLKDEESDGPVIFAFISFCYIAVVFLISRFVGPVYEPMYASDKASVAFFSQFFWLPIGLIASANIWNTKKSFVRGTLSLVAFTGLLFSPTIIEYQAVKNTWWHKPLVKSLALEPELPIICTFPSESGKDWESLVCSYFMAALNSEDFIDSIVFWQSQAFGPRPVDLSLARKFLIEDSTLRNLLVLSCSELDDGMKDFFGLVGENRVRFVLQKPCNV